MEKPLAAESSEPTIYPIEYALGILDYLHEYRALCAKAAVFSFPYEMTTVLGEGRSVLDTPPEDDINELIEGIGGIPAGITDAASGQTCIVKLLKWRGINPEDPTRDLWDACNPADPEAEGEVSVGLLDIRNDLEGWLLYRSAGPAVRYRRTSHVPITMGYRDKPAGTVLA